jgi:hypothetical protein
MSRLRSRSPEARLVACAVACACALWSARARAQACCAGSGVVTPGRLASDERALVGLQAKAGTIFGSFDTGGHYASSPSGASELDLEEDVFGALRVLDRGQVALLVPVVQTRRATPGLSDFGGGVGDVNLSLRYDFTRAGGSLGIPGIALLAGLTAPTGKPPDAPDLGPLAAGATGVGAWQANVGLAVEQAFGPWLVGASAFVAQRTARTVGAGPTEVHERLGAQWTMLAVGAYTFWSGAAIAASASYTVEGDATIDGVDTLGTAHRLPTLALSGVLPLDDAWRVQAAISESPPIGQLGLNQPAGAAITATIVRAWR